MGPMQKTPSPGGSSARPSPAASPPAPGTPRLRVRPARQRSHRDRTPELHGTAGAELKAKDVEARIEHVGRSRYKMFSRTRRSSPRRATPPRPGSPPWTTPTGRPIPPAQHGRSRPGITQHDDPHQRRPHQPELRSCPSTRPTKALARSIFPPLSPVALRREAYRTG